MKVAHQENLHMEVIVSNYWVKTMILWKQNKKTADWWDYVAVLVELVL